MVELNEMLVHRLFAMIASLNKHLTQLKEIFADSLILILRIELHDFLLGTSTHWVNLCLHKIFINLLLLLIGSPLFLKDLWADLAFELLRDLLLIHSSEIKFRQLLIDILTEVSLIICTNGSCLSVLSYLEGWGNSFFHNNLIDYKKCPILDDLGNQEGWIVYY